MCTLIKELIVFFSGEGRSPSSYLLVFVLFFTLRWFIYIDWTATRGKLFLHFLTEITFANEKEAHTRLAEK